jgi:hypothetical protein
MAHHDTRSRDSLEEPGLDELVDLLSRQGFMIEDLKGTR